MDKHLNNWLDKVEGKPENTTNNAIKKEIKRQGIIVDYNTKKSIVYAERQKTRLENEGYTLKETQKKGLDIYNLIYCK